MSEKSEVNKPKLDAAIKALTDLLGEASWSQASPESMAYSGNLREAITILSDWPRWEPLIRAAGKVDKTSALAHLTGPSHYQFFGSTGDVVLNAWMLAEHTEIYEQLIALLEAIPAKDENAKEG